MSSINNQLFFVKISFVVTLQGLVITIMIIAFCFHGLTSLLQTATTLFRDGCLLKIYPTILQNLCHHECSYSPCAHITCFWSRFFYFSAIARSPVFLYFHNLPRPVAEGCFMSGRRRRLHFSSMVLLFRLSGILYRFRR